MGEVLVDLREPYAVPLFKKGYKEKPVNYSQVCGRQVTQVHFQGNYTHQEGNTWNSTRKQVQHKPSLRIITTTDISFQMNT